MPKYVEPRFAPVGPVLLAIGDASDLFLIPRKFSKYSGCHLSTQGSMAAECRNARGIMVYKMLMMLSLGPLSMVNGSLSWHAAGAPRLGPRNRDLLQHMVLILFVLFILQGSGVHESQNRCGSSWSCGGLKFRSGIPFWAIDLAS